MRRITTEPVPARNAVERGNIHGNVKTLLQDNLHPDSYREATTYTALASQRFKRLDYRYDLVSGNVHRMSVQNGQVDQWHLLQSP
jgi:hypothetical protein